MIKMSGVFPVLPTPFTSDNRIDPQALDALVAFVVGAGVDGVVYPGMASEVETLAPDERAVMVQKVGQLLDGRLPLIVGASDADPHRAAAHAEEGRRAGARAAMIMAPALLKNDIDAHCSYYQTIADKTALPIMLQNAPQPMGAGLSPEQVAAIIKRVPAIRYVKEETLPCGQHVTHILSEVGDRLDGVFGGAGARYLMDELARGAAGTMPATELADVHVAIWRAFRQGQKDEARRLYSRTLPLLLFQAVFRVRLTKAVLSARSLLQSRFARAAGPQFDAADEAECNALMAEAADLFKQHPVRTLLHGR